MTPLDFVILCLATWRVSVLFSKEEGPFDVFKRLREKTGIQHDDNGEVLMIPHKFFAELLSCVWCTSIWVGAFWGLFWLALPNVCIAFAILFAFSSAAILIDRLT